MRTAKKDIVSQRRAKPEIPEIFVKIKDGWSTSYASAHIRVKSGKYNYLAWREGGRVRNFYLGQKKNTTLHTSQLEEPGRPAGRRAAGLEDVGQNQPARARTERAKAKRKAEK